MSAAPTTKKFQGGERTVPHASQKASKYYGDEAAVPKKARKSLRPYKPRSSLKPGAIVIILAGRYRGKKAVLLNVLPGGVLLVSGPLKLSGVPVRRLNSRYAIVSSTIVPLSVDKALIEKLSSEDYFKRDRKADKKKSEEAFFGENKEKKQISQHRIDDQRSVDKALLTSIKKEPFLASYLSSSFSLRSGDRPHLMTF